MDDHDSLIGTVVHGANGERTHLTRDHLEIAPTLGELSEDLLNQVAEDLQGSPVMLQRQDGRGRLLTAQEIQKMDPAVLARNLLVAL